MNGTKSRLQDESTDQAAFCATILTLLTGPTISPPSSLKLASRRRNVQTCEHGQRQAIALHRHEPKEMHLITIPVRLELGFRAALVA